jgi:hypothetical protein
MKVGCMTLIIIITTFNGFVANKITIYKVVAGTSSSSPSFSYKSDLYNQLYFYSLGRIYCT